MKAHIRISFFTLFIFFNFHGFTQTTPTICGTWRWDVKTLTDKGGIDLLSKQPYHTTIDQLVTVQPPKVLHASSPSDGKLPRYTREKQVVEIIAYVTEIKSEDDNDLHFVLQSLTSKNTMVGEIPDPACPDFDTNSVLREHFQKTREAGIKVKDLLKQSNKPVKVKITGIPFWDGVHSTRPTGASKYFREIHPILSIEIQ